MTTMDIRDALDDSRREIEDEAAFQKLVVDPMRWDWTTPESVRSKVIGNARHAWHEALRWQRERTALKGN